jgi:hypothetical protein
MAGVFQVFPLEGAGISENGSPFFERDAMHASIPGGFSGIPGEHIYVYTIINRNMSRDDDFMRVKRATPFGNWRLTFR